jgi:hypothetical protein
MRQSFKGTALWSRADTNKDLKEMGNKHFSEDLYLTERRVMGQSWATVGTMGTLRRISTTPRLREIKRRPEDSMEDRAARRWGLMMGNAAR